MSSNTAPDGRRCDRERPLVSADVSPTSAEWRVSRCRVVFGKLANVTSYHAVIEANR
jgi:hypothetical protein